MFKQDYIKFIICFSYIKKAGRRCPRTLFACGDGKCISKNKVCDTITNCANNADERGCRKCKNYFILALNKQVFLYNYIFPSRIT